VPSSSQPSSPTRRSSDLIIMPIIRQMINQSFTLCLYDLKYPDLGKIAYYHHIALKAKGKCSNYKFHVINLNDPCMSRRVNPFKRSEEHTSELQSREKLVC